MTSSVCLGYSGILKCSTEIPATGTASACPQGLTAVKRDPPSQLMVREVEVFTRVVAHWTSFSFVLIMDKYMYSIGENSTMILQGPPAQSVIVNSDVLISPLNHSSSLCVDF